MPIFTLQEEGLTKGATSTPTALWNAPHKAALACDLGKHHRSHPAHVYGPVQSLCTARAWRATRPLCMQRWCANARKKVPPPPVPRNQQCLTAEPGGGSCAHFPPKFDRGTRGWFLRMTVGSPVPRKKKSGALHQGMRALSFPTVNHIDK